MKQRIREWKWWCKRHKGLVVVFLCISLFVIVVCINPGRTVLSTDIFLPESAALKVHFIDVGQADCILIQSGDKNMLVDAGNTEDSDTISEYLLSQGVTVLDYVIATHGHEDHIGAMDDVMEAFPVSRFYMPKQKYQTQSYEEVIQMADQQNIEIQQPEYKEKISMGDAQFTFVTSDADTENYEDLNDSSIGIRLVNGRHSFLMCGDISEAAEEKILDSRIYIRSDVLKVSHHGSNDTTSYDFLERVAPEYAVISCGKDNDFGHPHKRTLRNLKRLDVELFRTDEQGTIVFVSNGRQLTCNSNPIWE